MNATQPTPGSEAVSLLDHRVRLGQRFLHAAPWLAVVLLALLARWYGLRTYPLDAHEAALAGDALAVVTGGDLSRSGASQPLPTVLAALAFFLFGPGDGAARLPSLLAGLAALPALAALERALGRGTALAAAVLVALSPTATLASTRLDGTAVLVLVTFLAGALVSREVTVPRAVALGTLLACLPLAHPLGWLLAAALGGAAVVLARERAAFTVRLLSSAVVALGVVSTLLLTRPAGFANFLAASWSALWQDYLATVGTHGSAPLVLLVTDELPVFVAGIVGAAVLLRSSRRRWPVATALGVLVFTVLFGNGSRAALTLLAVATALLGAFGLATVVQRIPWSALLDRWNAATLGTLALVVCIGLSLAGRLLTGPAGNLLTWVAGSVSLALLLSVMVWILRNLWPQASAARATPLVLVLFAFLALASRNALLVNATTSFRPGTLLHRGESAPGLVVAVERIRRASTDSTMFQFDPRDPTGGHGLTVTLEADIAQPFVWYLRDFPNLRVARAGALANAATGAQVVIVSAAAQGAVAAQRPDLVWQPVPYRLDAPASLARPDWGRLAVGLVDPRAWREYVSFLLYRRVSFPARPETVFVGLSPDVAALAGYPAVP